MNETRDYWQGKYDQAVKDNDEFSKRMAESKLAEIDDGQLHQEREQRQQEEVEGVALPNDYDTYYGVDGLNAEIQNLLRQVIAAKNEQHNEELAGLMETHKQRLVVAETGVTELGERCRMLQAENELQAERIETLKRMLHEESEMRNDAEKKRDNAVEMANEANEDRDVAVSQRDTAHREVESLKDQVNELEAMIRTFKAANKPTGGMQLTSTLKPLSEDEIKAKRERERLEFINRRLSEKGIEPLSVPPLPSVNEDVTEEAFQEQMERVNEAATAAADSFPLAPAQSGDGETEGGAETPSEDASSADTEAAPTLADRVASLEAWQSDVREVIAERFGMAV